VSEFVIRALGSATPADLGESLPLRASTLTCLSDASGHGEFWCARLDKPVKYRVSEGFDRRRCQPEFLAVDCVGEFLWVVVVVVWASQPNERLHPGMEGLGVQVAYVVDQTLGRDSFFDHAKVDLIGAAVVDDVGSASDLPGQRAEEAGIAGSPEPTRPPAAAAKRAVAVINVKDFDDELDRMVATLATLTGLHPGPDLPQRASGDVGERPGRGTYQIGPNSLRYYRFDPATGWQWTTVGDLDELLYRVVDDTARQLAWRWAEKAPIAAAGTSRREAIAGAFWGTLMAALDSDWGARSAEAIDTSRTNAV
jgi:hypothetical protein